jgi:hypothetical protein
MFGCTIKHLGLGIQANVRHPTKGFDIERLMSYLNIRQAQKLLKRKSHTLSIENKPSIFKLQLECT